jgi:hypothetical protein
MGEDVALWWVKIAAPGWRWPPCWVGEEVIVVPW